MIMIVKLNSSKRVVINEEVKQKIKQLKKDKKILLGTSFTSIALFLLSLFL